MPFVQNIQRRTGLLAAMLLLASLLSGVATLYADTGSTPERHSDSFVTGRVLSATDGQPMANVRLTLGDHTAISDARGIFIFTHVASGYQLVKVDQLSLEPYRRAKPGKPAPSHLHVDPVLVNVMSDQATELPYPIYVVEPHPAVHPLTAGRKAEIRPAHLPQFRLMVPEGTTINSEDGQTHTGVSITPLRPDRVPKLPDTAAPRTVYLVTDGED